MALDDPRQSPTSHRADPPDVAVERSDLFIGGRFAPAESSARVTLISPATEQAIGSIVDSGRADIDAAVKAARQALPAWRALGPQARGRLLGRLAELFESRMQEIARLVSWQNGSVISRSLGSNGLAPLGIYRAHAEMGASLSLERLIESPGAKVLSVSEPVGVVGAIVPWNAPQGLLAGKLAPSLLAGCTVVVKPSPETSLDALLLAELLVQADFPSGVVNIVTGGRETGAALVDHPGIQMISFTGSTLAGRMVAARCGEQLKEVTAELGGKSAAVLLDDADLDLFASKLIETCVPNSGQVCYSNTRILAPRSRFDEVVEAVTETLRAARVGEPLDPEAKFGPLVTARQRERVEGYIASGKAEGARTVLGGGRPAGFDVGYYVEPTVFVDVEPG
ncbi:MAG: aldehyde dehydrogenase family protein, partial [Caulobacteraceae bacterium]|nr:aldehyde dehydrogenase family protein [Caulobacteraceae bacterium]